MRRATALAVLGLLSPLARKKKANNRGEIAAIAQARALTGDAEGALRAVERSQEWFLPGELCLRRGEVLATLGRHEEALDALEEARRRGSMPEVPCFDPDLASLRSAGCFQDLYRCGSVAVQK